MQYSTAKMQSGRTVSINTYSYRKQKKLDGSCQLNSSHVPWFKAFITFPLKTQKLE